MEIFKDIKGYEGLYQINENGEVKSLARLKGSLFCKEKILKHDINNCGYHRVTLSKNDVTKRFMVHRLVYETFVDDLKTNMQIHHIDENKNNNSVENLMQVTARENNHYSAVSKGYKLTQKDVDDIRKNNMSVKEVVEKYKISNRHALRIIKNERWVS